jgi:5-methylcytosine-specific restriction endonuclease McrA
VKAKPTIREICGTESGYRKHRRTNEQYCSPCGEAHNTYRRETYNPDKNRQYATKYKAANLELIKERAKKYYVPVEGKEAKRLEAAERREAKRFVKQKAYDELCAFRSETTRQRKAMLAQFRTFVHENLHEIKKREVFLLEENKQSLRALVKGTTDLKAKICSVITEAKQARWQEYLNRPIDHGTTYAEYHHCVRKNPGGACKPCRKIASEHSKQWRQQNPERIRDLVRQAGYRRRMRKEAVEQVPYTRKEILERDDYCCHICGGKVNLAAPNQAGQPGWEDYPHLDHVIPLSKGGPDTPNNVRTSHARCNIVKSDKLIDTPEMAV